MPKKVTKKTEAKNAAPRARRRQAKSTSAGSGADVSTKTLSEAEIRARAYEIYRRGENPSDPTADWFQAEQELRSETSV